MTASPEDRQEQIDLYENSAKTLTSATRHEGNLLGLFSKIAVADAS